MFKKKKDDIELIDDVKEKKKINFKLNNTFKRYFLFFLVSIFLEFMFAFFIYDTYYKESVINITIFSLISSSVLSILSGFFKGKGNRIVIAILLFFLGFIYSVQLVFYSSFKTFFSFTILGLGDQLESFIGTTLKMIWKNIIKIIVMFIPFISYLIFKKRLDNGRNKLSNYLIYLFILLLSIGLFNINMNKSKGKDSGTYYLYHDVNSIELNVQTLGVLHSYGLDLYRAINGFEEKIVEVKEEEKKDDNNLVFKYNKNINESINFDKGTSNNDIKTINNYMKKETPTDQNQYTGLFKGYNLIYITAESFSELAVSEELTPTLYKLTHSGFIFDNYYTPNNLSTIGGEFQSLTGLYPDSSILSKWRTGTNYFPYGLGTVFKGLGYKTYAYHDNWYGFQDRHKYLKSQGFTNYLGCYNGLEKRMNCKQWPQSDDEMIKVTTKDYINSEEPFLAYYMTVSGHFGYTWSGNAMSSKNKSKVRNLKVTESAKAYVATQIELDKALERLINELEKAGKLDNTVIVLLADHYPYNLDLNSVNSLSSYKRDGIVEVNHNNLILWNNKLNDIHIDKACMSSDVLPTVYNLFGVEYDSRLFTGRDILSTSSGLAVFNNRSWVSDKGTYFASSHKFVPKETMENQDEYVKNMNAIVKNRLNIAKLIVKNNYYNYLFK